MPVTFEPDAVVVIAPGLAGRINELKKIVALKIGELPTINVTRHDVADHAGGVMPIAVAEPEFDGECQSAERQHLRRMQDTPGNGCHRIFRLVIKPLN